MTYYDQAKRILGKKNMKPSVKALSMHLKSKPEFGVLLVLKSGQFTLHLEPALDTRDKERTEFFEETVALLLDAVKDLRQMVDSGEIKIRKMIGNY